MNQIYSQLVSGSTEYKENGEQVLHPPTSVMLRAARAIQELVGINNTNGILIQQLQQREEVYMQAEHKYLEYQTQLEKVIHDLSIQLKECNESLCQNQREISVLGDPGEPISLTGDSSSEGRVEDRKHDLSTDR